MIGPTRRAWRVGNVSFLNARPLEQGLADDPRVELTRAAPSRLAAMLEAEQLDAALVPVISYFRLNAEARERRRHRPLVIVPDIAIASRGPVASVLLFCRVDYGVMRHVALDPYSQTSNCLVRLVLKEVYDVQPHYRWPTPDPDAPDEQSDAFLLIGNRAMMQDTRDVYRTVDLGEAWQRHAGLPFVYAVWAVRETDGIEELADILAAAKTQGLRELDRVADEGAAEMGIAPDRARRYLRENVFYDLGAGELAGLQKFYRWASDEELAPLHVPIRLVGERDGDEGNR